MDQQGRLIVPALWIPIKPDRFPEAARSVQFRPEEFGPEYAEHGFYLGEVGSAREALELADDALSAMLAVLGQGHPFTPSAQINQADRPPCG